MGWSLIDFTADLTGRTSEPSSTPALLLILSKQKIFRYFMHMRAKTICGFQIRVEEGSEVRPVRFLSKSISDHPIYSPPLHDRVSSLKITPTCCADSTDSSQDPQRSLGMGANFWIWSQKTIIQATRGSTIAVVGLAIASGCIEDVYPRNLAHIAIFVCPLRFAHFGPKFMARGRTPLTINIDTRLGHPLY